MLKERQIVQILSEYYPPPNYWTVTELRIKNILAIQQLTAHRGGQHQVQIDLAVQSQEDQQLVFIEAETVLTLDHPILYRPFAHYVYLAVPESAIQNQPYAVQQQQFHLAQQKKIGILGVEKSGQVLVHVSAKWCPIQSFVFTTVSHALQKKWSQQINNKI
ncbi:MAG: hypothetical protein ACFFBD_20395 [Candidatus Hodarchaeota archaeon]